MPSLILVLLPPMLDARCRFVLRRLEDLTRVDRNLLRNSNNYLIQLASPTRIFLQKVFMKQCPGESGTQRRHRPQDQSNQQEWR